MLAYLDNETGMERIQMVLEDAAQGHVRVVLSVINLGEVLYIIEREVGLVKSQTALAAIEQLPIEILPAIREAVLVATHIKANYSVADADAFAFGTAQELSGTVITGDPEFHAVTELIAVEWLNHKN